MKLVRGYTFVLRGDGVSVTATVNLLKYLLPHGSQRPDSAACQDAFGNIPTDYRPNGDMVLTFNSPIPNNVDRTIFCELLWMV